jgi:integrase
MGHSDISVTAKIYTHTTDNAIKNAANLMNTFVRDGSSDGKTASNP